MIKKGILERSLKSLARAKINILNVSILSLLSSIIIFGFSYMTSIQNLWNDWTKKSIDFRTYSVTYNTDKITKLEAINKLSKIDHIEEVTDSSGYIIDAIALDYVNNKMDGQITIRGVPKNSIHIVKGKNLTNDENSLICAKQFNPTSDAYYKDYDIKNIVDLTKKVGSYLKLKVSDSTSSENFKLVGLYDSNYNYSSGDTCYATFETVSKLNRKYQSEIFLENMEENNVKTTFPIYMVIDDVDNFKEIESILLENGFYSTVVSTINTEVGNKIIIIILIISWILCIFSLAIMITSSFKRIQDREKEFAICKAIGYSSSDIGQALYVENFMISCISFLSSLIISKIALIVLKNVFLIKDVEFSRINLSISVTGLIIALSISIVIPFITSVISTKKIENINILKSIREQL